MSYFCCAHTSVHHWGQAPFRSWQRTICHSPRTIHGHGSMWTTFRLFQIITCRCPWGYAGTLLVLSVEVALVATRMSSLLQSPCSEHVAIWSANRLVSHRTYWWKSVHQVPRQHPESHPPAQIPHTIVALLAIVGPTWRSCIFRDRIQQKLYHSHPTHGLPECEEEQSVRSVSLLLWYPLASVVSIVLSCVLTISGYQP